MRDRVVGAWVRAVQAARGAAHTRATAEVPAWSPTSCRSTRGRHQAGEVKVYHPAASWCDS